MNGPYVRGVWLEYLWTNLYILKNKESFQIELKKIDNKVKAISAELLV